MNLTAVQLPQFHSVARSCKLFSYPPILFFFNRRKQSRIRKAQDELVRGGETGSDCRQSDIEIIIHHH